MPLNELKEAKGLLSSLEVGLASVSRPLHPSSHLLSGPLGKEGNKEAFTTLLTFKFTLHRERERDDKSRSQM